MIRLSRALRVWRVLRNADQTPRPLHMNLGRRSLLPLEALALDARLLHDTAVCAMMNGSGTYDQFLRQLPPSLCPCQGAIEDPGPEHLPACPYRHPTDDDLPF